MAVKDGAVAEMGTHNELMEKNGVYKQLVLRQVHMVVLSQYYNKTFMVLLYKTC